MIAVVALVPALRDHIHLGQHDAEQAVVNALRLRQTALHDVDPGLAPFDDVDIGVDDMAGGADIDDRRDRRQIDNDSRTSRGGGR